MYTLLIPQAGNYRDYDHYPIITGRLQGDTFVSFTLTGLQWLESVMRFGSSSCLASQGGSEARLLRPDIDKQDK